MDNNECRRNSLAECFRRLKGQPVEILTEGGYKLCGIDVENDDDSLVIIDSKGRYVRIMYSHIDAIIEPQQKLEPLCGDTDCCCRRDHD